VEQLARAARDANHEALLQLIARGVDLKTYLPLEWDLPAVATGTLRVAHAEFTALHLLAAKGGFASECIRTALRYGADPSMPVLNFNVTFEYESSSESEEEETGSWAGKKTRHEVVRAANKGCRREASNGAPWAEQIISSRAEPSVLLAADFVAHSKDGALDANDLKVHELLKVSTSAPRVDYPNQSMASANGDRLGGFTDDPNQRDDVTKDIKRTAMGPAPYNRSRVWDLSWDSKAKCGRGAELFEAGPKKAKDGGSNLGNQDALVREKEKALAERDPYDNGAYRAAWQPPAPPEGKPPVWNQF